MAVTLNASTSSGFIATSDTSGSLELQANGTTKATVGSTGLSIGQYNPAVSLITSGAAVSASSTSVDFTGIPSWAKRITVMFQGVSTNATGSSPIQIQIGSGSVTTSGYACAVWRSGGTATFSSGFVIVSSLAAATTVSGTCVINLLGSNTYVETSFMARTDAADGFSGGGSIALGGTLDRVRITTVNGTDTFDAGTINILYE